MPDVRSETLTSAVARGLRALREDAGASADKLARAARRHGLPWTRNSVAALEGGRRGLPADELLLLPTVASTLLGRRVGWAELFEQAELVELGGHRLRPHELVELLHEAPSLLLQQKLGTDVSGDRDAGAAAVVEAAKGDAERKVAAALQLAQAAPLDVTAEDVARAALEAFGRSLTDERETRLEARLETDGGEATPRRRQAVRGRLTRQLVDELRPALVAAHNAKTARADRVEGEGE